MQKLRVQGCVTGRSVLVQVVECPEGLRGTGELFCGEAMSVVSYSDPACTHNILYVWGADPSRDADIVVYHAATPEKAQECWDAVKASVRLFNEKRAHVPDTTPLTLTMELVE